jgi:hypothetical protein
MSSMLHYRVGSWPYPQTLDLITRDKHLSLWRTFVNNVREKFYNIGPWAELSVILNVRKKVL